MTAELERAMLVADLDEAREYAAEMERAADDWKQRLSAVLDREQKTLAQCSLFREGLEDIWEMYCDGHAGDCACVVCSTVVRLLGITLEQRGGA